MHLRFGPFGDRDGGEIAVETTDKACETAGRHLMPPSMAQYRRERLQPSLLEIRAEDQRDDLHHHVGLSGQAGCREQRGEIAVVVLGRPSKIMRPTQRPVERGTTARFGGADLRRIFTRHRQLLAKRTGEHIVGRQGIIQHQ